MTWLPVLATAVTPADQASGNIVTYIVGYGPLGVIALALAWVLYKGTFVTSKSRDADIERAVAPVRAENQRLIERAEKAENQRDEALKTAQEQLIPLLVNFTSAAQSLIPLLQDLVRHREGRR